MLRIQPATIFFFSPRATVESTALRTGRAAPCTGARLRTYTRAQAAKQPTKPVKKRQACGQASKQESLQTRELRIRSKAGEPARKQASSRQASKPASREGRSRQASRQSGQASRQASRQSGQASRQSSRQAGKQASPNRGSKRELKTTAHLLYVVHGGKTINQSRLYNSKRFDPRLTDRSDGSKKARKSRPGGDGGRRRRRQPQAADFPVRNDVRKT